MLTSRKIGSMGKKQAPNVASDLLAFIDGYWHQRNGLLRLGSFDRRNQRRRRFWHHFHDFFHRFHVRIPPFPPFLP